VAVYPSPSDPGTSTRRRPEHSSEDVDQRVAIVTGASRGLGAAIALGLARAGFHVIGVARSEEQLASVGRDVEAFDRDFLAVVADLSDVGDITTAAARSLAWKGGVDCLVNAAGMIVRRDPPHIEAADIDVTFAVNVRAPLLVAQACSASLAARGGSIVNVASLAAEQVTRASVTYQASKAALVQLTRALAVRFGPAIRVNAVGPGYIATSLNRDWLAVRGNRAYIEANTALGRVGEPEDVVGLVVFLASPAARYITGQHILIDGGWHVA
jgi:NAD(P)-dependent dehydrogenase (short-subunit alcohol dehydrogenase family)